MYKGIKNSILGIEKELQIRDENVSVLDVIKSVRIGSRMKFGQNSKNAPKLGKKSTEEFEALSKIQKKTMSKAIVKAQYDMREVEDKKREEVSELQQTSSKLSDNKLN